jgi:hypothetical protein
MLTVGDRIELVEMTEDPDPIPSGTRGTVDWVNELPTFTQIGVRWDNGRSLMFCVPPDRYTKLASGETA